MCKQKMGNSSEMLSSSLPSVFREFLDCAFLLKFDEEPDYARYISIFDGIVDPDPSTRPIITKSAEKVVIHIYCPI